MVVDNRTWIKNVTKQPFVTITDIIGPISDSAMKAKAVLICRPNSHPFTERTLILDQPVKIGRSVARARPTPTNAIFDCKVLSRNHALLWYENGKFYLQDTKSSNGTFVNNNRLSAGGVDSTPHEVCSGDIVQFGVDVMENNRKVTHGCIVATLKLYLHDGKEAKASHSLSVSAKGGSVPLEELYKLNQYLQDALEREQLLESKMKTLYTLVEQAREASNSGWQAFICEDRLLSRVEILENQLQTYTKNFSDDKIKEELQKLLEDKCSYQNAAKESLQKVHQERLDALDSLASLRLTLSSNEEELTMCKEQLTKVQEDLQELAEKYSKNQLYESTLSNDLQEANNKIQEQDQKIEDMLSKLETQEDELVDLNEQIEKLRQDKSTLRTLITDLQQCITNDCPVELKFKIEKIIKEDLDDIKKESVSDECNEKFEENKNNKENNVPFYNQTDNFKLNENRKIVNYKDIKEFISNLQDDIQKLQEDTEENDNKIEDLDNLQEKIVEWISHFDEQYETISSTESTITLVNEDNSFVHQKYGREVSELIDLKQKLQLAQNEIAEKNVTISKMSEEVEHLLESTALVNAKIVLLETDLTEEKQISQKFKKEIEVLKQELGCASKTFNTTSNQEILLKTQIENLTSELNKRPSVESFEELKLKSTNLERLLEKLKNGSNSILENAEPHLKPDIVEDEKLNDLERKALIEVEEELVWMKERYAECRIEKVELNKKLDLLQKQYDSLINRSHNIMFMYMAPIIILVVAYLLFFS